MQTMPAPGDFAPCHPAIGLAMRAPVLRRSITAHGFARDAEFVEMLGAFRHSGGLARASDVNASIDRRGGLPIDALACRMVHGEVLHFEWQSQAWLPLFQFGRTGPDPQPGVGRVMAELAGVLTAWEMAQWFARPHPALAGHTPADAWAAQADAVLRAACAERCP